MEEAQSQQHEPPKAAQSPAELMAARREARRKRILENSNNRLTKITGREHNEPVAAEDQAVSPAEVIYPDPEDERDVYQQPEPSPFGPPGAMGFPPGADAANGDIFSLLNTLSQAQQNGFPAGMPFGSAANSPGAGASRPTVQETRIVKFLRTKIHIALLSIVVYLLFATGQQHWIGGSVFVLLLGWETVEMLLLKTYEPQASFLDVVFLLGGISKRYSQFILKMTQTINKVLKDVAFFVFFFVVTHLLWSRFVLGIDFSYVLGYDQLNQPIAS